MNHLRKLLNIEEGEERPVVLLFTYFFFFGATLTVSKTARDAYFLTRFDISYLPLMFLAAACAVALTVVIYNLVSRRLGLFPTISLSGFIFAVTLVLIQPRLKGGFIPFLYVWVDVITMVISVQFSVLAGMVFNSRQAKRLFYLILCGSPVARIAIGASIPPFVGRFGSDYLLTLAAVFILCCVLMAWLIRPYILQGALAEQTQQKQSGESRFLDSYLKMITVAIGAAAVATVIVEYQFLIISSHFFPLEEELAGFFGIFYSLTGIVSLFTQLFLTGWILKRFGILPSMLVLPAGLGIGSLAILISPLLLSSLIARTSEQITKFTINKTSFELLWVPVDPEHKQHTKLFIDGTIKTGLQGLTGVLIFLFLKVWRLPYPVLIQVLSLIALVSIGVWTLSAYRLKKGYVSTLMSAIEKRRVDFEQMQLDIADSDTIAVIEQALDSNEEAKQVFVLELIEDLYLAPWRDTLNRLFQTGSPLIQQKILSMAADSPEILSNAEILAKIEEQGPLAGDAMIIAGKRHITEVIPTLRNLLENTEEGGAEIRGAAATAILIMNRESRDLAQSTLEDLLNSEESALNVPALRMLIHVPGFLTDVQLREYLESDSIRTRMATLEIVRHRNDVSMIPGVIDCLRHPQTIASARSVLGTYPAEEVVAALNQVCIHHKTPTRLKIEIIRTLKDYPGSRSIRCLVTSFEQPSLTIRAESVDALLEIARQEPLPAEVLHHLNEESPKLTRQIYSHYQMVSLIENAPESLLLRDLFTHDIKKLVPILLKLLVLHVPETPVETYLTYVQSGDTDQTANLLEILENILPKRESSWIIPLLEPISIDDRCRAGHRHFSDLPQNLDVELLKLTKSANEWRTAVGLDYVLSRRREKVLEQIDWASLPVHGLQGEIITRYLARDEGSLNSLPRFPQARFQAPAKELQMLSTLEKTIILKETDLLEGISGEEIFHVAQVMEEERLDAGTALFHEGDLGDYLYVIVTGEILIHIGEKEVNRHGKGEYFGEMALLDDTPRSTSATAVDETLLLKISQKNFYDIMMSHLEVMKGILKMLTDRLRKLTDRYAQAP